MSIKTFTISQQGGKIQPKTRKATKSKASKKKKLRADVRKRPPIFADRPDIRRRRNEHIRRIRERDAERDKLRSDYQDMEARRYGRLLEESSRKPGRVGGPGRAESLPQIAALRPEKPSTREVLEARRVRSDRTAAEKAITERSAKANEFLKNLSNAVDNLNQTISRASGASSAGTSGDFTFFSPRTRAVISDLPSASTSSATVSQPLPNQSRLSRGVAAAQEVIDFQDVGSNLQSGSQAKTSGLSLEKPLNKSASQYDQFSTDRFFTAANAPLKTGFSADDEVYGAPVDDSRAAPVPSTPGYGRLEIPLTEFPTPQDDPTYEVPVAYSSPTEVKGSEEEATYADILPQAVRNTTYDAESPVTYAQIGPADAGIARDDINEDLNRLNAQKKRLTAYIKTLKGKLKKFETAAKRRTKNKLPNDPILELNIKETKEEIAEKTNELNALKDEIKKTKSFLETPKKSRRRVGFFSPTRTRSGVEYGVKKIGGGGFFDDARMDVDEDTRHHVNHAMNLAEAGHVGDAMQVLHHAKLMSGQGFNDAEQYITSYGPNSSYNESRAYNDTPFFGGIAPSGVQVYSGW